MIKYHSALRVILLIIWYIGQLNLSFTKLRIIKHNMCQLHQFSSVAQLCPTLRPQGLQYARLPWPPPTPGVYSNSCPSHQWCHPTISSSVIPFSSCLQFCPASVSFPMSQFFVSGDQSIGVSASSSVLSMNIQNWFPLGLTGLISLQSKELSRIFSNTIVINSWDLSKAII